jgi:peroxiredoxin Q/BCP
MKQKILTVAFLILGILQLNARTKVDFTIRSVQTGSEFTLSKNKGKIVVLHFLLKTECPYCLRHTHDFALLAQEEKGVIHLFVKPDSKEDILKWTEKLNREDLKELPEIYQDENANLADLYQIPNGYKFHNQVVHFPALIILDKKGKEIYRYIGKNNSDRLSVGDYKVKMKELTGK